jgi:SAM-dependent methyltransferase
LRVLEVGAGSGVGTLMVADAFPRATIVCLEPDDSARAALAWRIEGRPDLHARVSVLPLSIYEVDFLGTFDLVIARHLLHRTPPDARGAVLMRLSRRMGYDGSAVIDDCFGVETDASEPRRLVAQRRLGDFTCSHWSTAENSGRGERTVVDEFTLTDRRGDDVHQSQHQRVEWVANRDLMLDTVRAAGMAPTVIADGWIRLTAP